MPTEEKILDRIQKLIDKAMSTEFEPEQQALLQKADALMMQYSIDQVKLNQRAKTDPTITGQSITLRVCLVQEGRPENDNSGEVRYTLDDLFIKLVRHFHCKVVYKLPDGQFVPTGHRAVLGFPSDIDFVEMLFLQLKMHMLANISPKMDPTVSWVQNLANFKNCGYKWVDIHYAIRFHPEYPWYGQEWVRKIGVTFTSRYKKFCELHGIERVTTSSPATWRSDFITGYAMRIGNRLREMREQTVNENDLLPALFKDKDAEVQEEYYTLFPEERPHPEDCKCDTCERRRKPVKMTGPGSRGGGYRYRIRNSGAMSAGARVANTADLSTRGGKVGGGSKGQLK